MTRESRACDNATLTEQGEQQWLHAQSDAQAHGRRRRTGADRVREDVFLLGQRKTLDSIVQNSAVIAAVLLKVFNAKPAEAVMVALEIAEAQHQVIGHWLGIDDDGLAPLFDALPSGQKPNFDDLMRKARAAKPETAKRAVAISKCLSPEL